MLVLQDKVAHIEEELANALSGVERGKKLLAEERQLLSNARNEAGAVKDDLARERLRAAGLEKDVAEARGQLKRVREESVAEAERLHGLMADKESELAVAAIEIRSAKVMNSSHIVEVETGRGRERRRRFSCPCQGADIAVMSLLHDRARWRTEGG